MVCWSSNVNKCDSFDCSHSRIVSPASRTFVAFARFLRWLERICLNRVTSLLSMRCMLLGYSLEPRPNGRALVIEGSVTTIGIYGRTSTNGHLSTTAIFSFFGQQSIHRLLFKTSLQRCTSLQWLLSPVPKMAVLERFNCICKLILEAKKPDEIKQDWFVQKLGLRRLLRLNAIQACAQPPLSTLSRKKTKENSTRRVVVFPRVVEEATRWHLGFS